jgi:hypothetical protein
VCSGRDGEEFRKPFYYCDDDCLKNIHIGCQEK